MKNKIASGLLTCLLACTQGQSSSAPTPVVPEHPLAFPGGGLPTPGIAGAVLSYTDAGQPYWLAPDASGQVITTPGVGGNAYWGSAFGGGLGPSGTIFTPPSVTLNDAGAWLWVNQQGSTFTNASNGLRLSTTYTPGGVQYGALVHPSSGSATQSIAASWVWIGGGTGNTSTSYLGFGVAMFCSTSNDWVVWMITDQWNNFAMAPYLQLNYGSGTTSAFNLNVQSALSPNANTILRIRQVGTSGTSNVAFEISQDGVLFQTVESKINNTLFGTGNLATDVGFGFLIPNDSGMSGSQTATYYNYVEN